MEEASTNPASNPNPASKYTVEEDERRHIGAMISANRGLVAQRKRATKTPRMKYKEKYEKKLKKRRGQVGATTVVLCLTGRDGGLVLFLPIPILYFSIQPIPISHLYSLVMFAGGLTGMELCTILSD